MWAAPQSERRCGPTELALLLTFLRGEVQAGSSRGAVIDEPNSSHEEAVIGRGEVMRTIVEVCRSPGPVRTVIVWAKGGSGKTLLAESALRDLREEFPGGAEFINLLGYNVSAVPFAS